jgi:putative FmdB family regulatory protein
MEKSKMPIYEFKCKECENLQEELCFNKGDIENIVCRSCGSKNVEKQLSVYSHVMKEAVYNPED